MIIVRVGLARDSAKQNMPSQGAPNWSSSAPRISRHRRDDSTFEIDGSTFVEVTPVMGSYGNTITTAPQTVQEVGGSESQPLKTNNSFELEDPEARSIGIEGGT